MKKKLFLSIILSTIFLCCAKNTRYSHLNQIPNLIKSKNLEQKFNLAKWEIYKNNMYDTLGLQRSNQKVSFLKCDLGITDSLIEIRKNYVANDTIETIYILPIYDKDETDFLGNIRDMVYGASFKGDVLKYLPIGDKGFSTFSDSISKINERQLIKYIQANRDEVNPWLVEYATFNGLIK